MIGKVAKVLELGESKMGVVNTDLFIGSLPKKISKQADALFDAQGKEIRGKQKEKNGKNKENHKKNRIFKGDPKIGATLIFYGLFHVLHGCGGNENPVPVLICLDIGKLSPQLLLTHPHGFAVVHHSLGSFRKTEAPHLITVALFTRFAKIFN